MQTRSPQATANYHPATEHVKAKTAQGGTDGRVIDLAAHVAGPDPRARRARLAAAVDWLAKDSTPHQWRRYLTDAEAQEWAARLAALATDRLGIEADEAAKIARMVAKRRRRQSHTTEAQAARARNRHARHRQANRPRYEAWEADHAAGMSWRQLEARDGVKARTIRDGVYWFRRQRTAEAAQQPEQAKRPAPRGGALLRQNVSPDILPPDYHCSTPSAAVTPPSDRPTGLDSLDVAGMQRHLRAILDDRRAGYDEEYAILAALEMADPTPAQQVLLIDDYEQGQLFPF